MWVKRMKYEWAQSSFGLLNGREGAGPLVAERLAVFLIPFPLWNRRSLIFTLCADFWRKRDELQPLCRSSPCASVSTKETIGIGVRKEWSFLWADTWHRGLIDTRWAKRTSHGRLLAVAFLSVLLWPITFHGLFVSWAHLWTPVRIFRSTCQAILSFLLLVAWQVERKLAHTVSVILFINNNKTNVIGPRQCFFNYGPDNISFVDVGKEWPVPSYPCHHIIKWIRKWGQTCGEKECVVWPTFPFILLVGTRGWDGQLSESEADNRSHITSQWSNARKGSRDTAFDQLTVKMGSVISLSPRLRLTRLSRADRSHH